MATRAAPAARAWSPARRQQEAGDLRAQRAPSAPDELLRPARAPPPQGQLQSAQTPALDQTVWRALAHCALPDGMKWDFMPDPTNAC